MNQFTVKATVTFVNELHLTKNGIDKLMTNPEYQPTADDIQDQNLVRDCDVLILRMSDLFKKAWAYKSFVNTAYLIKSKY